MSVSPGQQIIRDITVRSPVTLEEMNASAISGVNVLNGVDGAALTIVNKSTGVYTVTGTVPAGAQEGAQYQWRLSATVDGVPDNWTYEFVVSTDDSPSSTRITAIRGDTIRQAISGLGSLVSYTEYWLTVKKKKSDADADSIIQVKYSTGLEVFKGDDSLSASLASLTVVDEEAGTLRFYLDETLSKNLYENDFFYDVQGLAGPDTVTLRSGIFSVSDDVTRAVE